MSFLMSSKFSWFLGRSKWFGEHHDHGFMIMIMMLMSDDGGGGGDGMAMQNFIFDAQFGENSGQWRTVL
jgi:hypothetical protein